MIVNIGFVNPPSSIICPLYLCTNHGGNYIVSCPTPLPSFSSSYVWASSNASIIGSGSSATLSPNANATDILLSVSMTGCGGIFSKVYTRTITRSTTVPAGAVTRTQSAQTFGGVVIFTYYPPADATSLQESTDGINWSTFNPPVVEVEQGTTVYLYVRPANDCGTGASVRWRMVSPICPSCGAITTYVDNGTNMIINSKSENNTNENIISSIKKGDTEMKKIEVIIFPNPADQNLTVNINSLESSSYKITLYDMLGKEIVNNIKAIQVGANEINIDLSVIENGIYLLYINDGKQIKREKIVVSH